jgi:hypothetical protein
LIPVCLLVLLYLHMKHPYLRLHKDAFITLLL